MYNRTEDATGAVVDCRGDSQSQHPRIALALVPGLHGRTPPSAVIRRIPGRAGSAQDGGSSSRRTAREATRAPRIPTEPAIMVSFDNPATVPAPVGQYSHVARAELGDKTMLQLSGQAAIDADGEIVGGNDMGAQEEYIMDNITAILAARGATLADVVNIRTYVTDM